MEINLMYNMSIYRGLPGVGDCPDPLDGVGAGAGVHPDEVRAPGHDPLNHISNLYSANIAPKQLHWGTR